MDIPDGLDVATTELLLQGVNVKIEAASEAKQIDAFPGYHKRITYCIVDGVLCRITVPTGKQDRFGN